MRILILGSNGMVGSEISSKLDKIYELRSYDHSELDITDHDSIYNIVNQHKPNFIINSAAYTNVEKAEKNSTLCYEVNSDAVKNLAVLCNKFKSHLIHLSTDYVFDGTKSIPYTENDATKPLNVYGDSKNKGDEYIKNSGCDYVIFRTSWVYGPNGNNFVKNILQKAILNDKLEVVCDQYGSPTSSLFIAEIIEKYLNIQSLNNFTAPNEIFNLCPSGSTSWLNLADTALKHAHKINPKYKTNLVSIGSKQYKTLAKRPKYSVFSNQKLSTYFDIDIQNWEYYLEYFLDTYIN